MRKHIVIIENDKDFLEVMRHCLEDEGHVVTGFTEFPSLPELVFLHADCFVIDEWFPKVSGHAICLMLKAKIQTKSIPVILTSPAHFSEPVANFCEADAVIRKSCNIDEIVPIISSVLHNRQISLSRQGNNITGNH